MDDSGRVRVRAAMPVFFSLVLILGMVLGFNLRDTLRNKRDISDVVERNDRLEQVIDLINEKYVDSVNSNNLYNDAISGILKSLDPHTVYIPAENLQEANEDLDGEFSGVGIEYAILKDTVSITSVLEAGPAAKAGVTAGDQLIKVGDSLIAGTHITSTRIAHLLKGKQKSRVLVSVLKYKEPGLKVYNIARDIIPLPAVDAGFMLDEQTGFIKINRFSATAYNEFHTALAKLVKEGAQHLVIDLRDNPGGYLDQVTSIADELLPDNRLIVYTEGSHAQRTEYKTEKKGLFEQGKLAVLINESSASASEILAGAIQDWDRGVIVGKRSFGKGLVQEPYEMTDGSEIRLTVAKYYTPSGRCIQRSFARGRDAYEADYERRVHQ
ncbi:MAG: S41 family peptidase, partial [Chitinophagia bacterium]|nr:S41 family peptidase [Chitinophagia bacterium]